MKWEKIDENTLLCLTESFVIQAQRKLSSDLVQQFVDVYIFSLTEGF